MTVYVDGSGHALGGPGGCGYVAYGEDGFHEEGAISLPSATNQRAEILAAAFALHKLPEGCNVTVMSDSEYVVKGWGWLPGWIGRGWRTSTRGPVANQRHWQRLQQAAARHRSVRFEWLRGHAGHPANERADLLAGMARAAEKARQLR